jgi:predicted DCC family thiol-disulfide oxidoreductase YuxK
MPDISMCYNSECPKCNECYRFLATPGEWQYYEDFKSDGESECEWFIPVEEKEQKDNG